MPQISWLVRRTTYSLRGKLSILLLNLAPYLSIFSTTLPRYWKQLIRSIISVSNPIWTCFFSRNHDNHSFILIMFVYKIFRFSPKFLLFLTIIDSLQIYLLLWVTNISVKIAIHSRPQLPPRLIFSSIPNTSGFVFLLITHMLGI